MIYVGFSNVYATETMPSYIMYVAEERASMATRTLYGGFPFSPSWQHLTPHKPDSKMLVYHRIFFS